MDTHHFECCCLKVECSKLLEFNESFKKMEHDAFLAAEIGQALLKEKINGEEDSSLTYSILKDNLQLHWEKEGLVDLLQAEIKSLKETTIEMKKKLEYYEKELEKKKLCEQLLIIKTDIEEELKTQVSDLKQEICQLDKSEKNIQLKYKRLESNYETLQLTHESLLKEHDSLLNKKIITEPYLNQRNIDTCHLSISPKPIANIIHKVKHIPQFHVSAINCNKNPFDVLQSVTQQTLEKIHATDTRVLNRRLRRVFDMSELSDMSNTILTNILTDLDDFNLQFDWAHDDDMEHHFFPLVHIIQQLLQEISNNRITLNDLQADYVRRIERLTNTHYSSFLQPNTMKRNEKSILQELLLLFSLK